MNLSIQDLAELRGILLDVIDDGAWRLYQEKGFSQDDANAERLDFCDEVQRRLTGQHDKQCRCSACDPDHWIEAEGGNPL